MQITSTSVLKPLTSVPAGDVFQVPGNPNWYQKPSVAPDGGGNLPIRNLSDGSDVTFSAGSQVAHYPNVGLADV